MFRVVDVENWNRKELYEKFVKKPFVVTLNTNVDVTKLVSAAKHKKIKFSTCFVYAISRVVNKIENFRIGFNEKDEVGIFDVSSPKISVLKKGAEIYSSVVVDFEKDFLSFHNNYLLRMKEYEEYDGPGRYSNKNGRRDFFIVSYVPNIDFSSFVSVPIFYDVAESCVPFFCIGKWTKKFFKVKVPLSFRVSHLAVDGLHLGRFVDMLKAEISLLSKEILKTKFE